MAPRGADRDVAGAVAAGEIDPIYALHGAERFLLDRALVAIRKAVLDPKTAGFNHDVFDLKESGLGPVLAAARTVPMMAKRRLVVGKGLDEVKAESLEPLVEYAADPNPTTVLVLVGEKVDTRFRAFVALRKAGYLHDFKPLGDRELGGFITAQAKARGAQIAPEAAHTLAEIAGPDLGRLDQAVEQLSLYAGRGRRIELDDVETLITETRQRNVFELTKAIGAGDRRRALHLLANMLANREPPIKIEFMLARQMRQVGRAKELMATQAPRAAIASAVGVSPYFLDEILAPARQMSRRGIETAIRRLYEADRALKSSRQDPEVLIARLVDALVTRATSAR